ncbi:hypothetical protein GCM10010518_19780 [Kitasatospora cinereorecta]
MVAASHPAVLGEGDRDTGGGQVVQALGQSGPVQRLAHLTVVVQRGPKPPVAVPEPGEPRVPHHERRDEQRRVRTVQGVQDAVGEGPHGVLGGGLPVRGLPVLVLLGRRLLVRVLSRGRSLGVRLRRALR